MRTFVTHLEMGRRKKGLTQKQLARLVTDRKVEMSASKISLIEQGEKCPKPEESKVLIEVLGIKKII